MTEPAAVTGIPGREDYDLYSAPASGDVDKAKSVLAIKRSMNPGFAGIENELYFQDNTLMVFGDAKQVLGNVVKALAGEAAAA